MSQSSVDVVQSAAMINRLVVFGFTLDPGLISNPAASFVVFASAGVRACVRGEGDLWNEVSCLFSPGITLTQV